METTKPIFIIGVGRSGSTIFHRILSKHPNVSWLSRLCEKYPNKPTINRILMKMIDYPIMGRLLTKRIKPGEAYGFWEFHCKGFTTPCRDLIPLDVTEMTKEKIQNVMSKITTKKRNRLLIKITGWPRVGFLHEIFNDAKFIHIIRDGRAVVNSMINVDWWWGWRGPQNWRWGDLSKTQKEEWQKYHKSFIALAAIEWKILMDAFEKAKKYVSKNKLLEVKYEDLCSNPSVITKKVINFCELEWSREFNNSLRKHKLNNTNYKWKKELTLEQQNILENILFKYLKKFDYL